ncbi:unnamed protein product, partial [Cyprideis torosa]
MSLFHLNLLLFCASVFLFYRSFLLKRVALVNKADCPAGNCVKDCFGSLCDVENCERNNVTLCDSLKRFDRAIIIIIDALYFGFVVERSSPFKVIRKSLQDSSSPLTSFLFRFRADPPTTTLQRTKALTTGTFPTFIDAGSNFFNYDITEDSWIHQFQRKRSSIWVGGDEIWETLYPGAFSKAWSFPSFDAFDLDTIDRSLIPLVRQHMREQHLRGGSDWDVYIAHFLGVDHAGHRHGRSHPEMDRKLREMNEMVSNVVDHLGEDTLLVVMGDHGMTASGDHGGDTEDELNTAVWLAWRRKTGEEGRQMGTHRVRLTEADFSQVSQVDFVPTLSLLLGLPIPFSSLGKVIPEVFEGDQNKLLALKVNAQQVSEFLMEYAKVDRISQQLPSLEAVVEGRASSYELYLSTVQRLCRSAWATFDQTLYPGAFSKAWSFPSFDAFDLDTIDRSLIPLVRQHMREQHLRGGSDWDVYIAHFLGVDHAGHRHGRSHPEMDRKLREMNEMVSNVVDHLGEDTLLVVMGDHGMTASGDHGGDTEDELNTALWLAWRRKTGEEGRQIGTHRVRLTESDFSQVSQVDFVPTLSLLLGLPIPFSSLGKVIPEVFEGDQNKLLALKVNAQQVSEFLMEYAKVDRISQQLPSLEAVVEGRASSYELYLSTVQRLCRSAWATFDQVGIFVAVLSSCISLTGLFASLRLDNAGNPPWWALILLAVALGSVASLILLPVAIITASVTLAKLTSVNLATYRVLPWSLCLLYAFSFTSNSLIVSELPVLRTLVAVTVTSFVFSGFSLSRLLPDSSWKPLVLRLAGLLFLLGLMRTAELFKKCREEEGPDCRETFVHKPLASLAPHLVSYKQTILVLSSVSLILVTVLKYWLLQRAGNLSGETLQHLVVRYLPPTNTVAVISFWSLQCLPTPLWTRLTFWQRNGFALWVYASSLVGLIVFLVKPLLVSRQKPENRKRSLLLSRNVRAIYSEVRDSLGDPAPPVVMGLRSALPASLLAVSFLLFHPLVLLAGDLHSTPLFLLTLSLFLACFLLSETSCEFCFVALLLAQFGFFVTGHHATFSSIQWEAAFVGLPGDIGSKVSILIPGLMVLINTEVSSILAILWLAIQASSVSRLLPGGDVSEVGNSTVLLNQVEELCGNWKSLSNGFVVFSAVKLCGTMISCAVLRRHLMVWKIFAPRFIFEGVSFISTLFVVFLVSRVFKRASNTLLGFLRTLEKRS